MQSRITESELIAITDQEMRQAVGYFNGKLSEQRRQAEAYYLARPVGDLAPPDIEGRSSVVSTDVADTIEWMLPSLLKIFTASDNAVEFVPQQPDDEEAAKQATKYVNYVFYRQNPGFQLLYTWIKDALLQKTGIMKVYWDDHAEAAREVYDGLNDDELATLLEDPEVEAVEHSDRPDEEAERQKADKLKALNQQLQQLMQQANQMAHQIAQQQAQQAPQQAQQAPQQQQMMQPQGQPQ